MTLLTAPPKTVTRPARLLALDALRGFDMFWILGADEVAYALRGLQSNRTTRFVADQLDHAAWAGFHCYDLIFPLFVFIVGVALAFSLQRTVEQHGRGAALKRIAVRTIVLFALGIVYNGGLSSPWPDVRLLGVLQRIAIAYGVSGTLFVLVKPRTLAVTGAAILAAYWLLLTFVPVRAIQLDPAALAQQIGPDAGGHAHGRPTAEYWQRVRTRYAATTERVTGRYEPGLNLANHLDFEYLPGRMYDVYWDPEGLLSSLPAVATCLCGVLAGLWLSRGADLRRTAQHLALAGVVALALGYGWGLEFPVIKKLWTSSFVLVAAGWSLLLLAVFVNVIEVRGWRRWCAPFVWIGMNPITLYLATSVVGFNGIARRFVGGSVQHWIDQQVGTGAGGLLIAVVSLLLLLGLARFLYRRGIFLKV